MRFVFVTFPSTIGPVINTYFTQRFTMRMQ
jgi:hypothetical protein